MLIYDTYDHLLKFDESLLSLGKPIQDDRLELFEKKFDLKLTEEFKYIFRKHNGFYLGHEVLGLGKEFGGNSLDKVYALMQPHFQKFTPNKILPFSPDGAGNYYCLNLDNLQRESCSVLFYQHDYDYQNFDDIEVCNTSFTEWVDQVCIGWTLEEYDYSGTNKSGFFYKLKNIFR